MKYMLMAYDAETDYEPSPEEMEQILALYYAYTKEMIDAGVYIGGEGLLPSATATTLRPQEGAYVTTHGPYAETREQIGGFYIIDCENLDEAIGWAKKWPETPTIEIRPVLPTDAE